MGFRRAPRIRLGACLAGRRSRAVGQPLHHASARPLRRLGAAHHASHANQGQRGAGLMRRFSHSNKVLLILCLMYLILYVDRVNISTAAPLIKAELDLSNTELGLVFSAFAYPYALFQLIGGYFGDKFGARRTLFVSGLIVCAATAATGAVGGLASLFAARLALGIGEGATFPTATRAMAVWVPERSWGFAQGITHSSARIGNAVTPPLIALLVGLVSWRGAFVVLALLSLIWVVVWLSYFRDVPAAPPLNAEELAALPVRSRGKASEPGPGLKHFRRMLPVPAVIFCSAGPL